MFEMVRTMVVDDTSELALDYISLLLDNHFDSMTKVKVVIVVVAVAVVVAAVDNTCWVFVTNYNDDVDGYLQSVMDNPTDLY